MKRSKIELLPETIRVELQKMLINQAFSGYRDLADWLHGQGYAISHAAIHRFGQKFEERSKALKLVTEQARVWIEAAPDDEAAISEALLRMTQEKVFKLLLEAEIDPATVNFATLVRQVGELARVQVYRSRHVAEIRREIAARAAEVVGREAKRGGLSVDKVEAIRREILGIDA